MLNSSTNDIESIIYYLVEFGEKYLVSKTWFVVVIVVTTH